MTDLFGNESAPAWLRASAPAVATSLFDAAAERAAFASGRPVSQERTRITHPGAELEAGAGLRCLRDHPLRRDRKRGLWCEECDQ